MVFFDTETTGFSPNYIISLAYIAFQNGKRVSKGYIECNPDFLIEEQASKIHGFTNEKVKNFPLFIDEWGKIKSYFENSIWIGHNESFDHRALKTESKRYNFNLPQHMECCTLKNAKKLINKNEIENYKLTTLCNYLGIKFQGDAHNAFWDALACVKVYNKLVNLSDGKLLITVPKD